MKRRLLFLDLILVALLVLIGIRFREVQQQARDRAARNLNQRVKPDPIAALPATAPTAPTVPANYADIAIKMLFSRDRNPTVILDPVAPPPEKPMPPLPVAYGAMFFGEPSIILAMPNAKAMQRIYHKGEVIGEFKVVNFDNQQIVFEWNGKTVQRNLDQIMAKPSDAPPQETVTAAKPATTTTVASTATKSGPGDPIGNGFRACVAGDTTPAGTVIDGVRKIEAAGLFGKYCRWVPVQ